MNIYSSSMASCITDSGALLGLIEEERLSRKKDKKDHGMARKWCEAIASTLGLSECGGKGSELSTDPEDDNHHLYHAVSAYIQSGFEDAVILAIDGCDEKNDYSVGIFTAKGKDVKLLRRYSSDYSPGRMFSIAADYCGLTIGQRFEETCHAGKVMGLATYCNEDFTIYPERILDVCQSTGDIHEEALPASDLPKLFKCRLEMEKATKFSISYARVAAYTQYLFERTVWSLLHYMKFLKVSNNLIITGGCALNCTMNGKVRRSGMWKNIFIPPLCTDAGLMLGKAHLDEGLNITQPLVYNTKKYRIPYGFDYQRIFPSIIASAIEEGKVIAWFEGGSEYGPRALGHRSLLADPSIPWMAGYLNELKGREHWRPFAPVILDTLFTKVFAADESCKLHDYMLATEEVRPWYQRKYPAIVAPDGTSRPQVLRDTPENHMLYQFMVDHHLPILVNTSMNGKGEPICESLKDAINFVLSCPDPDNVLLVYVIDGKMYLIPEHPQV